METNDRPAVELTDSLLVEGSVVLAHRVNHKSMSVAVLTRDELQAFVQLAHDVYGVTADPFATPGSADPDGSAFLNAATRVGELLDMPMLRNTIVAHANGAGA